MPNQKKLPFFPLYPVDFLGDTGRLNATKLGAYARLLFTSWIDPLYDDIEELSEISRVDQDMTNHILIKYFKLIDGIWCNSRLERERIKAWDKHRKRSEAGKMGAKAKHGSSNAGGDATGDAVATQNSELISHNTEERKQQLNEIVLFFPDGFFPNMSIPELMIGIKEEYGQEAFEVLREKVGRLTDVSQRTGPYVRGIIKGTDFESISKGLTNSSGKALEWLTKTQCNKKAEGMKTSKTTDQLFRVLKAPDGSLVKFGADHRYSGQTVWVMK